MSRYRGGGCQGREVVVFRLSRGGGRVIEGEVAGLGYIFYGFSIVRRFSFIDYRVFLVVSSFLVYWFCVWDQVWVIVKDEGLRNFTYVRIIWEFVQMQSFGFFLQFLVQEFSVGSEFVFELVFQEMVIQVFFRFYFEDG